MLSLLHLLGRKGASHTLCTTALPCNDMNILVCGGIAAQLILASHLGDPLNLH